MSDYRLVRLLVTWHRNLKNPIIKGAHLHDEFYLAWKKAHDLFFFVLCFSYVQTKNQCLDVDRSSVCYGLTKYKHCEGEISTVEPTMTFKICIDIGPSIFLIQLQIKTYIFGPTLVHHNENTSDFSHLFLTAKYMSFQ